MSFNLIDLVMDQVGGSVMDQIGGLLGENSASTTKALGGAVPGLLDGLLKSVSGGSGGEALAGVINDTDDSILDNLSGFLGGGDTGSLMSTGSKILGSVLGNNSLGNIVGAVAGFSGMKRGSANSLIGLLAPIIFGIVKRKLLGSGGINASSIIDMLTGQKDNITKAMPQGFSDHLNPQSHPEPAVKQGSIFKKLIPLAIIAALIWVGYNYLTGKSSQNTITPAEESATSAVGKMADINVGDQLNNIFSQTTSTLGNITDVESAKAAVPSLTDASSKLGSLAGLFEKLPGPARNAVSEIAGNGMGSLQAAIDKVVQIPGVGQIIQPVTDGLMEKLAAFMQ